MWMDMVVGSCFLTNHFVEGHAGGRLFSMEPLCGRTLWWEAVFYGAIMWKDMVVGSCFLWSHCVEGHAGGRLFSKEPLCGRTW